MSTRVPSRFRWLFWDAQGRRLDAHDHKSYVLPRVLEFGGIEEVRWAIRAYGLDGIHEFLRKMGHPELSPRTIAFWRAVLGAREETWASRSAWRKNSSAPWVA